MLTNYILDSAGRKKKKAADPDETQSMSKSQVKLINNRDKFSRNNTRNASRRHNRSKSPLKKKLSKKMSERKMFHNPSVVHINRNGLLQNSEDERVLSGA